MRSNVRRAELMQVWRHLWVVGQVGWPPPSTFWRRDLCEQVGPFREDMRYAVLGCLNYPFCARLTGETADGRPILVVVTWDDPDFVITVFLRS